MVKTKWESGYYCYQSSKVNNDVSNIKMELKLYCRIHTKCTLLIKDPPPSSG